MVALADATAMVVKRHPHVLETRAAYAVSDADGATLASVVQIGRDNWDKTLHPKADADQLALAERIGSDPRTAWSLQALEVRAPDDSPLWQLVRVPGAKVSVVVCGPDGAERGRIRKLNLIGRARLSLDAAGQSLGDVKAGYRDRNFVVAAASGEEIAEIEMTSGSAVDHIQGKEYRLTIRRPLEEPLRSLMSVVVVATDQILYG